LAAQHSQVFGNRMEIVVKLITTYKITLAVLMGVVLCSCASAPGYESATQSIVAYPQKAVLVQTPMLRDDPVLNKLFARICRRIPLNRVKRSKMP